MSMRLDERVDVDPSDQGVDVQLVDHARDERLKQVLRADTGDRACASAHLAAFVDQRAARGAQEPAGSIRARHHRHEVPGGDARVQADCADPQRQARRPGGHADS